MRNIFVTGIGTDVGKTVASAILTEALHADYWKPIQTGSDLSSDSDFVKSLLSNKKSIVHPERYSFKHPLSPHAAAELEGQKILLSDIEIPKTRNSLIIEGAGGVLVPLNENEFMVDMIKKFNVETIIVIQNYLGSINHSLLTIEVLMKRKIKILGVIINGVPEKASEDIILKHTGVNFLGRINLEETINKDIIVKYAKLFTKI
ncbi:MAG: dethiobiotin synthase [Bacteroidota bacterium]|nr:dethiobiotin synthase [Bacteroidota bacterium]